MSTVPTGSCALLIAYLESSRGVKIIDNVTTVGTAKAKDV